MGRRALIGPAPALRLKKHWIPQPQERRPDCSAVVTRNLRIEADSTNPVCGCHSELGPNLLRFVSENFRFVGHHPNGDHTSGALKKPF